MRFPLRAALLEHPLARAAGPRGDGAEVGDLMDLGGKQGAIEVVGVGEMTFPSSQSI